MEPEPVNIHITRLELFREIQQQFSRQYPFLKLEFLYKPDAAAINAILDTEDFLRSVDLLQKDIGLSDAMTVTELENALQEWFGTKITVLRKNGFLWMSTRNAEDWTLRQHNEQRQDIALGIEY